MNDWQPLIFGVCGIIWMIGAFIPKTAPSPDAGMSLRQIQIGVLFLILARLWSMT